MVLDPTNTAFCQKLLSRDGYVSKYVVFLHEPLFVSLQIRYFTSRILSQSVASIKIGIKGDFGGALSRDLSSNHSQITDVKNFKRIKNSTKDIQILGTCS